MSILKTIGLWLLRMFLGGIFKDMQNKEAIKANREADAAKIVATSAEEAKNVEVSILEKQREVSKIFKERQLPDDDPFGFRAFNKGT